MKVYLSESHFFRITAIIAAEISASLKTPKRRTNKKALHKLKEVVIKMLRGLF